MTERKLAIPSNIELRNIQKVHRGRELPYYKESFAQEAKVILDKLHGTGKTLRINASRISVTTLRLQYYQGAKYLVDHEEKYVELYRRTKCVTYANYIEFHIRNTPHDLTAVEVVAPWKDDFVTFIETAAPNDKFFREDVSLTEEEITWINNQLAPLVKKVGDGEMPLFYGQVERNKILLIRDDNS